MKISKQQIIKAICEEPVLKAGAYYHRTFSAGETDKNCPACMVGAVMRQATKLKSTLDLEEAIDKVVDIDYATAGDFDLAVGHGSFLEILSAGFESACTRTGDDIADEYRDNQPVFTDDEARMLGLFLTEAFCPEAGVEVVV